MNWLGLKHIEFSGLQMKTILKALFLFIALSAAFSVFAQSDFESTKARAEAGDLTAQGAVAVLYEMGSGVPESDMKAYMWYSIAVAQSTTPFQRELYSLGKDRVKLRLTRQALEEAQSQATRCFESNFQDCD
jgi:TPR repeat protein